jgi:hypothetical protein
VADIEMLEESSDEPGPTASAIVRADAGAEACFSREIREVCSGRWAFVARRAKDRREVGR